jgi:hypothetical protein
VPTVQIYGDESGFTGNNLLHREQPFFVYGTVAIEPAGARELVDRIVRDFDIASLELKGHRLLKFARGRKAAAAIIEALTGRSKTAVFEKRYALAAKFFEYVFEPPLAAGNALFYKLKFHLFIANLLYLHFAQKARYAEEIFAEFEGFMRTLDESRLVYSTSDLLFPRRPPVLELVAGFTVANIGSVREELDSLRGTDTGKWVLDLTSTALYSLLGEWGEIHECLEVFCDESKPLATNAAITSAMVGRTDKAYHTLFGERRPVTFNLLREVEFVRSVDTPGIQLADVVASATRAVVSNPRDRELDALREGVAAALGNCVVVPDLDIVDLESPLAKRHYLLLQELVRRSMSKEPLLERMSEFVLTTTRALGLPLPTNDEPMFAYGGL